MLILVGVTVTVSLNGGLFEKAREGAKGTEIAREKEELAISVATACNIETGRIKLTELDQNLPSGWSGTKGNYTSASGNKFTVYQNGDIVEGEIIITDEEIRQLFIDILTREGGTTGILEIANELKAKLKLSDKYNETDIFCTFTLPSEYNLNDEDILCFYIYPLDRFFVPQLERREYCNI